MDYMSPMSFSWRGAYSDLSQVNLSTFPHTVHGWSVAHFLSITISKPKTFQVKNWKNRQEYAIFILNCAHDSASFNRIWIKIGERKLVIDKHQNVNKPSENKFCSFTSLIMLTTQKKK